MTTNFDNFVNLFLYESSNDDEYLDAVKRGDLQTAQQLVDLTRKKHILPREVFYVGDVEIIRNPVSSDYQSITAAHKKDFPFDNSGDPTTRFTTDKFGNRWIWKSGDGMHSQIEPLISRKENRIVSQNEFSWNIDTTKPVVLDREGNVVPLSRRFDSSEKI